MGGNLTNSVRGQLGLKQGYVGSDGRLTQPLGALPGGGTAQDGQWNRLRLSLLGGLGGGIAQIGQWYRRQLIMSGSGTTLSSGGVSPEPSLQALSSDSTTRLGGGTA